MGASIHMHIEVKSGDTWHHYAAPNMFWNAVFFDLVAGIYDKLQPVAPLRGLPENLSFVTQHDWKQDSENFRPHHVGWLKAKELIELQGRLNYIYAESTKNPISYGLESGLLNTFINGNSLASHQGWDDLRLIFWFDN